MNPPPPDYSEILAKIEENTAASSEDARVGRFYTGAVLIFVILMLLLFVGLTAYSLYMEA